MTRHIIDCECMVYIITDELNGIQAMGMGLLIVHMFICVLIYGLIWEKNMGSDYGIDYGNL